MGKFDNLNDSQLPGILRRIRILETASPMNNSAIGRGGIEVYDQGTLNISDGHLIVNGTATFTGTFTQSGPTSFTGTFTQSGPSTFSGTTNLNGPTHINGATDIKGTLSVEGATSLKADLTVAAGAKVKVGSAMTLDPSVSSGALVFSNGAQVFTDATTIQVYKGTSVVQIEDGSAKLQGTGMNYVKVDSTGTNIAGPLKSTSGGTISGVTSNVYMDPATGAIKRIV